MHHITCWIMLPQSINDMFLNQVLSAYESTLEVVSKEDAYEHSEMLMLKATILEEPGCIEDAVKLLDTSRVSTCWE